MSQKRVLIVGGVAAGASCATRLRRLDEHVQIFIFERSSHVSFANCGLPYYLGGVITERRQLLEATPERFRDYFNIEVRTHHEVVSIDRTQKTIAVRNLSTGDESREAYDVLVLATGAEPVRPPLPGIDLPRIFTLRTLDDADRLYDELNSRKITRAVVVGAGYIGLEITENLVRRGLAVTLLEQCEQVLPQVDREMVVPIEAELKRQGVDLQLNRPVHAFESGANGTIEVVAGCDERFRGEIVILAMGVRPDVVLARQAGLELGPTGGIRVDQQMRTSDPNIFAVGDAVEVRDFVTGLPTLIPLAGPASRQGRIAGDVICGRPARYRGSQGSAVVSVFDLVLAMTGATEKTLIKSGMPYEKSYTHTPHHASYYPGAKRIALKLLFEPNTGKVLGAQGVGREGVEKRIDLLALAVQKGATIFDLEEAELCYAPQFGRAKDPINIAGFAAANVLHGDVRQGHWAEWFQLQAEGRQPVTLDVRATTDANAEVIPGAIRIPLGELRRRLHELPRDQEIWVHCGYGQTAYYATRLLRQHGFSVRNLSGGMAVYQMLASARGNAPSLHNP